MYSVFSAYSSFLNSRLLVDGNIFVRQVHFSDDSQTLRSSFSEKYGGTFLQEFGSVHESEPYRSLVLQTHIFSVHLYNLCSLSNNTTVDDSLVIWLDRSCIVQNYNFCFEIINWMRLSILVNQNHSLSEIVPLELLFLNHCLDSEADRLTGNCLFNRHPLVVNSFDLNGTELSLLVWSQ